MATIVPPPSKRQKLEASEKARTQAEIAVIPDNLGSIRVQFVDQSTGTPTGPVVSILVQDATVRNLENLLNTLQGTPSERVPYRFTFENTRRENLSTSPNDLPESTSVDVLSDLYASILKPGFRST